MYRLHLAAGLRTKRIKTKTFSEAAVLLKQTIIIYLYRSDGGFFFSGAFFHINPAKSVDFKAFSGSSLKKYLSVLV